MSFFTDKIVVIENGLEGQIVSKDLSFTATNRDLVYGVVWDNYPQVCYYRHSEVKDLWRAMDTDQKYLRAFVEELKSSSPDLPMMGIDQQLRAMENEGNVSMSAQDINLPCDPDAITITLPNASNGKSFTIKKLTDSGLGNAGSGNYFSPAGCIHDYVPYQGLIEFYEYCKHCNEKKPKES